MSSPSDRRPPAVIHVDLDGAPEIFEAIGARWSGDGDPLFETGMESLLSVLSGLDLPATLFTIGRSLEVPGKRRWLDEARRLGHEIASHTMTHANLDEVNAKTRRWEIGESKQRLEDTLGAPVVGFRAPGYRIDRACVEMLAEFGYEWDSSAFPTRRWAERLRTGVAALKRPGKPFFDLPLIEIPLPDYRPGPFPFNPSYALVLGTPYFMWGTARAARREEPLVLLLHLIDLAAPLDRRTARGWRSRFYTLSHLSARAKRRRCEAMLMALKKQFRVLSTREYLEQTLDTLITHRKST